METLTLLLFCAVLTLCVAMDISIVYALIVGLIIFLTYGKLKKHSWSDLGKMVFSGIKTVRNILITFMLIGMLTASWRSAGTISTIICYAVTLIQPSIFVLVTFVLNSIISVLTGTAFGTAATMGVICMTMSTAMQVNPLYAGGAILAGCFFGDRCSPVSTSALLVSELTGTNLFTNLKKMVVSCLPGLAITCVLYFLLGLSSQASGEIMDVEGLFSQHFNLHPLTVLPAVAVLVMAALRQNVKKTLSVSIILAVVCCVLFQGRPVDELLHTLVFGFQSADPELGAMMNGGGITSMLRTAAIITISSSYSGIFQKTGLLEGAKQVIYALAQRTTPYAATLATAIVASVIACNQTLSIMLTHQLCRDTQPEEERFALTLEDTAVVVAPLVPWSIAGAVPLTTIGAPMTALLWTCFLYLLPIWQLAVQTVKKRKRK